MSCSKPLFWVETHENIRRMWSYEPCRWTSFTLDRFAAEGCSYFYNSASLAWNYLEPWPFKMFRSSSYFYLMFQTEKSGILGAYFFLMPVWRPKTSKTIAALWTCSRLHKMIHTIKMFATLGDVLILLLLIGPACWHVLLPLLAP